MIDTNKTLSIWTLAEDRVVFERQLSGMPSAAPLGMAVNRSGDKVAWDEAVGEGRHKIAMYDFKSMKANDFMGPALPKVLAWGAPSWDCQFLAFSSDDGQLISCGMNLGLVAWPLGGGAVPRGIGVPWPAAAFSPGDVSGRPIVAVGEYPNDVSLRDVQTWRRIISLQGHASRVICSAFSPDGSRLLIGSEDCTVRIWDVKSGELLSTFKGHTSTVNQVASAPDGSSFASCSWDGTLHLRHTTVPKKELDEQLDEQLQEQWREQRVEQEQPERLSQGDSLARRGMWKNALQCYDRALETSPDSSWHQWLRTTLVLQSDNMALYRQRCQDLAATYRDEVSYDPKPCLIAGDAIVNLSASAKRAAEWVDATEASDPHLPWRLFTGSLAEYRCGKYRESIASLERMRESHADLAATAIYNQTLGFLLQAMAHHQLGEREQSREWFRKAVGLMDSQLPKVGHDEIDIWWDWIHCQVLLREADLGRGIYGQVVGSDGALPHSYVLLEATNRRRA